MSKVLKLLLLFAIISVQNSFAQISEGGMPVSFLHKSQQNIPQYIIGAMDTQSLLKEDEQMSKHGEPLRMGIVLPVGKDLLKEGLWQDNGNGIMSCCYQIKAEKAVAVALYYSRFQLSPRARMFVYSEDKRFLIGAFTQKNNPENNLFATEFIPGESLTVELEVPEKEISQCQVFISECSYAYRAEGFPSKYKSFGGSGNCEVNINCSEGDQWKEQKQSIVRILVKLNGGTSWCTGSLVNNTRKDYTPYILTADHCGKTAPASEISQWIFYFNYEAPSCSNPSSEGNLNSKSMVGAVKKAQGGTSGTTGSDFYLVQLNNNVPESYNPFFAGWDRSEIKSINGVSIHHPQGDIKKISTYTTQLDTSDWYGSGIYSHWRVLWSQTLNGYGVTEGGSSGSPIYNPQGYIIGTLSGGESHCQNLTGYDFYGKFGYSWDKNGTTSDTHLREWLDPDNLNPVSLKGISYSKVDFSAGKTRIKAGESINFINESLGTYTYVWKFQGAIPDSSVDVNPQNIRYPKAGNYMVELRATANGVTESRKKYSYIQVLDEYKAYYNVQNNCLMFDFGNSLPSSISYTVYTLTGRNVLTESGIKPVTSVYQVKNILLANGVYCVKLTTETSSLMFKFLIVK